MRMFLTRLGFGSKAVVTGDITQSDLPAGVRSGLREAREILTGVEGISFAYFTEADVVRHPLVQEIIRAYEQRDADRAAGRPGRTEGRYEHRAPGEPPPDAKPAPGPAGENV
jgi:phosphate starvation-inducible PhoH-like protein